MFRNLFALICLLFLVFSAQAQQKTDSKTIVSGAVSGAEERKIYLEVYQDFLSGEKILVEEKMTDASGNFQFYLFPEKTTMYVLSCAGLNAQFYAAPGEVLELIVEKPEKMESANMRGGEIWVDVQFKNLAEQGTNARIAHFEEFYNAFWQANLSELALSSGGGNKAYQQSRKEELAVFNLQNVDSTKLGSGVDRMQMLEDYKIASKAEFSYENDPFLQDYFHNAEAVLSMALNLPAKKTFRSYFEGKTPQLNHPEYAGAFRLFFQDWFDKIGDYNGGEKVKLAINKAVDLEALRKSMALSDFSSDPALEDWVVLHGLQEVLNQEGYGKAQVLRLIKDLAESKDSTEEVKQSARAIFQEQSRGTKGHKIEAFQMLNHKNDFVVNDAYDGIFTYYFFFYSTSPAALAEFQLLKNLDKKYRNKVKIVAVSMDPTYGDFRNFLVNGYNAEIDFLYGPSDRLAKRTFNVSNIPHAILVDPDGKLYNSYTKLPSEGIALDFSQLFPKGRKAKGDQRFIPPTPQKRAR